jgi:hypothetical protein
MSNVDSAKPAIIGSLFSDVVLLLVMLVGLLGLLRETREGGGAFPLIHTLWKQVWW